MGFTIPDGVGGLDAGDRDLLRLGVEIRKLLFFRNWFGNLFLLTKELVCSHATDVDTGVRYDDAARRHYDLHRLFFSFILNVLGTITNRYRHRIGKIVACEI